MIPANSASHKSGHFHAVRFYENKESLCHIVADFLGEGLAAQQPALIVGTPEHCRGVLAELTARHFDVKKMTAAGDLLVLDADDMLAAFMVDGMPDATLFHQVTVAAIEQLCRGRKDCVIRAYGEMVDVLWRQDRPLAAVALEMLWNKLAMTHQFSLLCGYTMGNFYKDASMADICNQHTHVVGADGATSPTGVSTAIN